MELIVDGEAVTGNASDFIRQGSAMCRRIG